MRNTIALLLFTLAAGPLPLCRADVVGGLDRLPVPIVPRNENSREPELMETSQPITARGQNADQNGPLEQLSKEAPIPLGRPSLKSSRNPRIADKTKPTGAMTTVFGSLAVVLALFFFVVWISRRASPNGSSQLPSEAVEMLGRTHLGPRKFVHLVRVGGKLLLVSITSNGMETLTEIDDAAEVERIRSICEQNKPGSVSATFRQVLAQFGNEPSPRGFLGDDADSRQRTARNFSATGDHYAS